MKLKLTFTASTCDNERRDVVEACMYDCIQQVSHRWAWFYQTCLFHYTLYLKRNLNLRQWARQLLNKPCYWQPSIWASLLAGTWTGVGARVQRACQWWIFWCECLHLPMLQFAVPLSLGCSSSVGVLKIVIRECGCPSGIIIAYHLSLWSISPLWKWPPIRVNAGTYHPIDNSMIRIFNWVQMWYSSNFCVKREVVLVKY